MSVTDNKNSGEGQANILVQWDQKYSVGIKLIDDQHKELVNLTNRLYQACLSKNTSINETFKAVMSEMVAYVRFHFGAENELLERINFPDLAEHKKQHETLIKTILETSKEFSGGNKFVPNTFVRTLRDWIFGHIAVYDHVYALYVMDLKKKGLITDQQLS